MIVYLCIGGAIVWFVLAAPGLAVYLSRYRDDAD